MTKNIGAFVLVALLFQTARAVEPTPENKETKETIEKVRDNGALKVEKTPAVSEEALQKSAAPQVETPVTRQNENPVLLNAEHLFGAHASIGVPHPVNFGLNYVHSSHVWSAEISTGSFGTTVDDTKLKVQNTELAVRWHPWAGSFYVGAIYGNQKITAEKSEYIAAALQYVNAKAEVKSSYLTPHFGWMWGAQSSGFFSSIEFGYQSPSNVKTELSSDAPALAQNTQEYRDLEKDVHDQGDKIGNMGLPHIVLIKIGWLF